MKRTFYVLVVMVLIVIGIVLFSSKKEAKQEAASSQNVESSQASSSDPIQGSTLNNDTQTLKDPSGLISFSIPDTWMIGQDGGFSINASGFDAQIRQIFKASTSESVHLDIRSLSQDVNANGVAVSIFSFPSVAPSAQAFFEGSQQVSNINPVGQNLTVNGYQAYYYQDAEGDYTDDYYVIVKNNVLVQFVFREKSTSTSGTSDETSYLPDFRSMVMSTTFN